MLKDARSDPSTAWSTINTADEMRLGLPRRAYRALDARALHQTPKAGSL
jgi:hypothetical protein